MSGTTDFMKGFLILGDIAIEMTSLADKVACKQRIVWATMRSMQRYWQSPQNWDSLTDEVKMERLEKLQNMDV